MKKIILFVTKNCSYCKQIKKFLDENDIDYDILDIGKDEIARNMLIERTGQMKVPVTQIEHEFVVGYDIDYIEKLIFS